MKTVACIISVNFPYYEDVALRAIRRYYNHFGIECVVIDKNYPAVDEAKTSPVWNKYFLFDSIDADFIIAQDLDIVPTGLTYNILDFINPEYVNLCMDSTRIGLHYLAYENNINVTSHPHFRFNAGLLCYPRKCAEFMKEVYQFGVTDPHKWLTYDQYYLNWLLGERRIFVNELPQVFNTFFTPKVNMRKIAFCHYTNYMNTLEKRDYILDNHPCDMLL